jgi:hypothetical protein
LKLWLDILKKYPDPKFSKKSVSYIWTALLSERYKHDTNPITSAKIILEEAKKDSPTAPSYPIHIIPMSERPGFVVMVFAILAPIEKWGTILQELSLDSACMWPV